MSRRMLALPVALVVALAGCATELPTPQPDAEPATPPSAVVEAQVEDILDEVEASLARADEERSRSILGARVGGPAWATRAAEYELQEAGQDAPFTVLPTAAQTVVAPATDGWPRMLMVVTEQPEDLSPPLLVTLVQAGPREQYRLWSWTRLFPGVQMPPTARHDLGSAQVAADADDLLVQPDQVVERYLDVARQGEESEFAATFVESDPLREALAELRGIYEQAVAENGSLTETQEPTATGPYALRTADGGALVSAGFRTTIDITLDDSTLTVADPTVALLGGQDTFSEDLTITWMSMVTFYVPPADSDQPVQVIGGEHRTIGASGD
jgi:hypothetical protein